MPENWRHLLAAFCLGFSLGSGGAWYYFLWTRLIRTRREWYADRKARGLPVPEDWEEE